MKWMSSMFLAAVLLAGSAPLVHGQPPTAAADRDDASESRNHRRRSRLPEGSGGVIAVLTVGALGGGLLIWRKKRTSLA